jgi:hypothetical protein
LMTFSAIYQSTSLEGIVLPLMTYLHIQPGIQGLFRYEKPAPDSEGWKPLRFA